MKFIKEKSTLWKANGEYGLFEIKQATRVVNNKRIRQYWATYYPKMIGRKRFTMTPFKTIKEAKEACEDSYYWEF